MLDAVVAVVGRGSGQKRPADAHDAGLGGPGVPESIQLMLMMLGLGGCFAKRKRAADAVDAPRWVGLGPVLPKSVQLMLMMLWLGTCSAKKRPAYARDVWVGGPVPLYAFS